MRSALHARSRQIRSLLIAQGRRERAVQQLEQRARAAGVAIEHVPPEEIDAVATGRTHGGVVAVVGERRFVGLDELVAERALPFVAMLDGVEDPFNFGYSVRALYAAGADGLVVRPRSWLSAAAVVGRASAGASELLPTAVAATAIEAADDLGGRGLRVVCAAARGGVALDEADLTGPVFLVIGGEHRGLSPQLLERADAVVAIPYGRDFRQALGTTSAVAVLAFEVLRQRRGR